MQRLLPEPAELTDDDLLAAYAVPAGVHLRANFVASADGAVTLGGVSGGLSSPADKRVFELLRDLADVVLVGAGTVRAEDYGYPPHEPERRERRRRLGLAELPTFAVVSGSANLDPGAKFFREAEVRPIVLTRRPAPALEGVADVVPAEDLREGVAALADRELGRILCEGGPGLLGGLTGEGLLDELCLTVAPVLAGAGPGRIIAGPPHPPRGMSLRHVLAEDGMLFLSYAVDRAG